MTDFVDPLQDSEQFAREIGHCSPNEHLNKMSFVPITTYSLNVMRSMDDAGPFVEFIKSDIQHTIPEKFAQIAHSYPDHPAVSGKTRSFTYQGLSLAADSVASAILQTVGQRSEPIVLEMEHDAAAIIAILGTLKAGKFYVPLDPRHPDNRNCYIRKDTETRLVLTDSLNYDRVRKLVGESADVLNIDTLDLRGLGGSRSELVSPHDLAYVIYTSGSTGTPKGIMQNHRNVLHRVMTYTNSVRIRSDDRVALLYSCSSAGSVRDIFGALLNGALLLPFSVRDEGWSSLAEWLAQEEISLYNSAATLFRHFAGNLTEADSFPQLRSIHVGSETIYKRDVDLYKRHFSDGCSFVARLGSTEISPICEYRLDRKTELFGSTVPAGFVVEGGETEILLLDESGREVGLNEIGEIAVKSPYLFPGYWRRPDLTKAAFVPDPGGGTDSVFRTGDLGRMSFNRCLEHFGRKDYQVKVRGYRVEIEEIEAVLSEHPHVLDAAVVLLESGPENDRLGAYVVTHDLHADTAGELRDFLKTRLPDYMIPSSFTVLDSLPRTANGKVDRSRLLSGDFEADNSRQDTA